MIRRERGSALLLVLWVAALLAALLAGIAAAARSESEAALYGSEQVRAELAAQAGLAHAIAGMRAPDVQQQWVPDGRPYTFDFDGARVTVKVVDVSGMLDLNASTPDLLRGLFQAAGANTVQAGDLANAIAAVRGGSSDSQGGATPSAAQFDGGIGTEAPHGSFRAIDQLARLPGMDAGLFARIESSVTVYSGRNFPDVSYAGPLVMAAVQGVSLDAAKSLVAARRKRPAQRFAGNGQAFGAVAGGALVAGYGGMVERVFSSAEMPDGTRAGVDATIRLALTGGLARPYKVLDWRPDSAEAP
jgi:general secretion pathway protein K